MGSSKVLTRLCQLIRAIVHGSTITLTARHGECGHVSAFGRTWGEAESKLRFKAASRGLDVDWKTLRPEPDNGYRPVSFICGCGHECVVKSWVVRDTITGDNRQCEGWACDTPCCRYNPSERQC